MAKEIVYRKLSDLKKLPNNPRTIKKDDMERLKKSIKDNPDYFEARPIILSNRTGDLVILAGNQRYEAAKALGMDEVPTFLLEGLTEAREREIIIRDNVSNGDWDMDALANEWDTQELTDWGLDLDWHENQTEYQDFVDKFKPKLTTDDCYTPPKVFEAVEKWVRNHYGLDKEENIRPFKPDGDYKAENYQGKIVIDNPPFSILSEIIHWYSERSIKFFLFAPYLTTFGTAQDCQTTRILTGAEITYENGAKVLTNFITNMDRPDVLVEVAGSLRLAIEKAQPNEAAELERYIRPKNLKVGTDFVYAAKNGTDWKMTNKEVELTKQSDYLKAAKKGLFGGGLFVSDKIAEKAAAEKAAAEKAAIRVELSDREQEIVRRLNGNE